MAANKENVVVFFTEGDLSGGWASLIGAKDAAQNRWSNWTARRRVRIMGINERIQLTTIPLQAKRKNIEAL